MTTAPATARLMQNRVGMRTTWWQRASIAGDSELRSGPEHVGGVERMAEARQVDRLVDQLAADQAAAARQPQLLGRGEVVDRQLELGLRGVRARASGRRSRP